MPELLNISLHSSHLFGALGGLDLDWFKREAGCDHWNWGFDLIFELALFDFWSFL